MEKPIIEIKNIGKKYNIAHQKGGYVALRDVIMNIIKSPFSFLRTKFRRATGFEKKEEFWALKDINFSIKKGEVVGIIGSNGAGKSTLLKILSQITPPTEGEIILRGRVGSLLEVGTGFHPELTGRENIFLNGAILGMKRKEIAEKFDEIVEFAGIEKFLDTPVKYYSSGMYVRLAFSVAAHMDPDILLVDEVLAVGDAEFQKKCLGKMEDITKKEGRTIIFVSHNMAAIQRLCEKTIILSEGKIKEFGDTDDVIKKYLGNSKSIPKSDVRSRKDRKGNGDLLIVDCHVQNDCAKTETLTPGKDAVVTFGYECKDGIKLDNVVMGFNVTTLYGESVFLCHNQMTGDSFGTLEGSGSLECEIDKLPLSPGRYLIHARIISNGILLDEISNICSFEVTDGDFYGTGFWGRHSLVYVRHSWKSVRQKKC